jgi:hypothetical protein
MNPGAPSGLDIIIGVFIAGVGLLIVVGGVGAIADRKQPQYAIGFFFLFLGCLVMAIAAKTVGLIH